jgi:hypothetical protein
MAKSIDPKGISSAGQNGPPPKTAVSGSGANVKTATNVPGAASPRNTKNPGSSGQGLSRGRKNPKGNSETISKGSLAIKPKSAKGRTLKTTQRKQRKTR